MAAEIFRSEFDLLSLKFKLRPNQMSWDSGNGPILLSLQQWSFFRSYFFRDVIFTNSHSRYSIEY